MAQWKIICAAFEEISAEEQVYKDAWLCDETWARAIKSRYPDVEKIPNFSFKTLNKALPKRYQDTWENFDAINTDGVYHKWFRTSCPYDNKPRKVHYYYRCTNRSPPTQPSVSTDCADIVARSFVPRRIEKE